MRKPLDRRPLGHLHRAVDSQIRADFLQLLQEVGADPNPASASLHSSRETYLFHEIFSKFVGEDTDSAELRRSRSISKWKAVDSGNRKTNHRLYFNEVRWTKKITSTRIIRLARAVIADVLGATPPEDVLYGTFSNGASTSKRRGPGVVARKFADKADVTPECWDILRPLVESCQLWVNLSPEMVTPNLVEGNVMFTVPKNATIDRVAAKEPDLNMFAQKGVGDYIRARLKAFGIDLNDQSRNQRLAKEASTHGNMCTIDLSSASDSISTTLVCLLLPTDWFYLLDQIRSKRTLIDGEWYECAMFSSMGNGFTFELESLIFYALLRALSMLTRTRGKLSVYGDDLICPSSMYPLLKAVFTFIGFKVNPKKSHARGFFRESCGRHYWRGQNVTPFYIKEPIANQQRLIHFLNRLRKWAEQGESGVCDPRYYAFWQKWSKLVDSRFHCGFDTDSIESLVSPGKPRYRLRKVSISLVHPEGAERLPRGCKVRDSHLDVGLYLAWLRTCDDRTPKDLVRDFVADDLQLGPDAPVIEGVCTSLLKAETSAFQFSRNHRYKWNDEPPQFPQELVPA